MTAAVAAMPHGPPRRGIVARFLGSSFVAVTVVVAAIIGLWYGGAVLLNAPVQRDMFARQKVEPSFSQLVEATWSQERPVLPAPHQVAVEIYKTTALLPPDSKRSLVYHASVTLSSTLLGFFTGTLLGIGLAVLIVHVPSLDKSLMPWIVSSQTIPILAIAPMIIVVLGSMGFTGLVPKSIISTYLSFFPVTIGMAKGLRSPDVIHLDLMRTYSATRGQVFAKLRWPSSVPFLFVSMKIAVAAALVGAIVGELPTGSVAGLGARMLTGSYYGQTIQIWSALVAASVMAGVLVMLIGVAERLMLKRMGIRRP